MTEIALHLQDERGKAVLAEAERRGIDAEKLLLIWIDERIGALANRGAVATATTDHPRDTLTRALGMARTEGPPPNVDEIKRQIDARLMLKSGEKGQKKSTIATILGIAKTDRPPPDDAEVKQYLMERRLRKYGGGLRRQDVDGNE